MPKVFYLTESNVIVGFGDQYFLENTGSIDENDNEVFAVRDTVGNSIYSGSAEITEGTATSTNNIEVGISKLIDGAVLNPGDEGY